MITRVQQEHAWGCQVAVLAMLLGISYQEALTYYPGNPDICQGFPAHTLETILVEQGFAIARKYKVRTGFNNEQRDVWPPQPFGPIYWVQVETSVGAHAVIMLEDGKILDPWDENRTSLNHPHYLRVNFVTAVVPICNQSSCKK